MTCWNNLLTRPCRNTAPGERGPCLRMNLGVRSFAGQSFWDAYRRFPAHVQRQARESYRFFASNPNHPSLDFKRVSRRRLVYSVRMSADYRALGVLDGADIVWFWIGPHHEYDRMLRRM